MATRRVTDGGRVNQRTRHLLITDRLTDRLFTILEQHMTMIHFDRRGRRYATRNGRRVALPRELR